MQAPIQPPFLPGAVGKGSAIGKQFSAIRTMVNNRSTDY